MKQIEIIKPKVIITLGNFATKFVLAGFQVDGMNHIQGISQLHGQAIMMRVKDLSFVVIPLYHPAAMLYNGSLRKILEEDFKKIREVLS